MTGSELCWVMADFGGPREYTTWDGEPVSRERPHGATVVVAAQSPDGWRYVLLHRGHRGPDWAGDWAWTPPTGSRKPGEAPAARKKAQRIAAAAAAHAHQGAFAWSACHEL